jgi:hypothetical protein
VREDLPPLKTTASLTYHSSANTTTSTTTAMTATPTDSFRTEKRRKWRIAENGHTARRWIKQLEEKKPWGKEEGSGGEEASGLEELQANLKCKLYYAIGLYFRYRNSFTKKS